MKKVLHHDLTHLAVAVLTAVLLLVCLLPSETEEEQPIAPLIESQQPTPASPPPNLQSNDPVGLPKVLWLYTDNELDSEEFSEIIYLYHFNATAVRFGFEVRMVNSWTAYDWLSHSMIQRISKGRMNAKVDEEVHSMLKTALLLENGGVLINQLDLVLLGDNFGWLEHMFDPKNDRDEDYACPPTTAEIFLLHDENTVYGRRYTTDFMAATPRSKLLTRTFQALESFLLEGMLADPYGLDIVEWNKDIAVNFISNSLEKLINFIVYEAKRSGENQEQLCKRYGIQDTQNFAFAKMNQFSEEDRNRLSTLPDPEEMFGQEYDKPVVAVRYVNSGPILDLAGWLLKNELLHTSEPLVDYQPDSLIERVLSTPGNREVFMRANPERHIELCLIMLDELDAPLPSKLANFAVNQTFENWRQVMFLKKASGVFSAGDYRHTYVNSSGQMLRNIEVAVTQHCSSKGYAVLLWTGETFAHERALAEIVKAVQPREVLGAFVGLEYGGKVRLPREEHLHFHRAVEGIVTPNITKMETILNHFRVFAIESFRYLPQFDLRDMEGVYFKDRMIFLMTFLEMVRNPIHEPAYLYNLKKFSHIWNAPRKAVIVPGQALLHIFRWEKIDKQQLQRTWTRLECEDVFESMHNLLKWKIPFSKMLAFNNGQEFVPAEERMKTMPALIPRIIHQVWLGTNEPPPAKQYLYKKTKLLYPNYEVKLWG
jgi:hypothetical protein